MSNRLEEFQPQGAMMKLGLPSRSADDWVAADLQAGWFALLGAVLLGGLGFALGLVFVVSPNLREPFIADSLAEVDPADFRAIAQAESFRYLSAWQILKFTTLPLWVAGGIMGWWGGRLPVLRVCRRFPWWSVCGTLIIVAGAAFFSWPSGRDGLVRLAGHDQFEWLEGLQSPELQTREVALQAVIELLWQPPFSGRPALIAGLASLGEEALPALPVLSTLTHDPEPLVQQAAEEAVRQLSESWSRQIDQVRGGLSRKIEMVWHPVTAVQLQDLTTDCGTLEVLMLERPQFTSAELAAVFPTIPALKRLKMGGPMDPVLLQNLVQLPKLEVVNLPDCNCTDENLVPLQSLEKLSLLRLGAPQVSDAGLKHLQRIPGLKYLHLVRSNVTDVGLQEIESFPSLQSFYVDRSPVTESGLSQLLQRSPHLHIHWNDLHLDGDNRTHQH